MIEPTPSLLSVRPGPPPPRASSAGAGSRAPGAERDSAPPFDDLVATARDKAAAPVKRSDKAPVSRQILAAPGTPLPDRTPAAAPLQEDLIPEPKAEDDSPTDAAIAPADDEPVEPRLEPALAWILPPPPAAAPVPVTADATLRTQTEAPPADLPVAIARPVAAQEATGDAPVPIAPVQDEKIPVSRPLTATPDGGTTKPPIQRLWLPEPAAKSAPEADPTPPDAVRLAAVLPASDDAPLTIAALAAARLSGAPVAAAVTAGPGATERRNDDLLPNAPAVATNAGAQALAVAATGGADQAGIDLTRDPGLHRMIDRIETLRDAADARDTRIRLIPDALGPVDVSVRRQGDAVHVHFTAAEIATRQLIADAQSRLVELADARGVRIDRTIVDGGATGQHGHTAGQPHRDARPALVANRASADVEADRIPDHRIA